VPLIELPVTIVPKPEAIEPDASAPTVVSDDVTTLDASVVPVRPLAGTAAAVIDVLQPNPVLVVQINASAAAEQLATACAVGDATPAVAFTRTVFAACVARLVRGRLPVTPPAPPAARFIAGIMAEARVPPAPISAIVLAADDVENGWLDVMVDPLPATASCPTVIPDMPLPPGHAAVPK
jgi:hypothetical protein